jgi:hypothetical protein
MQLTKAAAHSHLGSILRSRKYSPVLRTLHNLPHCMPIESTLPFYCLHFPSVTFTSLQRPKARFPTACSSGCRLFISAFVIASKGICNDTYLNELWSIIRQGMFQLREINQMEGEMCLYIIDWELNVKPSTCSSTNPFPAITPNTSTSPITSFGPCQASLPKFTPPPSISINPAKAYLTPPTTPDTPEPESTSSA